MIWYEDEIRQLENKVNTLPTPTNKVIFYGSSSIRLWTTLAQDFPQLDTLNLGFGGSTLAACAWFFERLVVPTDPKSLVFYAGDNDLGDGRHPEEVYLFFAAFSEQMTRLLPGVPMAFLSIKLSPARWNIADQIRKTNKLIQQELEKVPDWQYVDMTTPLLGPDGKPCSDFFESDGLHLTSAGYRTWQQALQQQSRIF
ncbi:GDSL-type esterase/lipase family protein [Spirosoma fluviale]|uniref:Lysophospholipase L1 n=1 Tax=Spirosoma fluviale TaxID=1597977 RepID=A0A286G6F2_9BACT|nr:GDSL-type esterase/lipase family protein [Spirosoma fluviale]SOD90786.1 Lysophospholipase L1 [Spirosoma fluviale]